MMLNSLVRDLRNSDSFFRKEGVDRLETGVTAQWHIRVKMGVVKKSGCAWSDIFKNQNKLSIFIRFILKENGFITKKWGQSAKITDFRDFAC